LNRRFRIFLALSSLSSLAAVIAVACSAPEPKGNTLPTRSDDSGTKTKDTGGGGQDPPKPEEDPLLEDGGKPPGRVFAHTENTLYLYEPLGKTLTEVGKFSCLDPGDRVLDIALDRNGMMYGTSDNGFLQIDVLDATCTYKKRDSAIQYPNSLAFVPLGTVDPTKEALVGYQFAPGVSSQATIYVQIDLDDGTVTKVGDLNPANAAVKYRSSGDLIALIRNGNKAYLTVKKIEDGGIGNDFLAEIDPTTGTIKSILGDTKQKDLWGLSQWAGTAYAFSGSGDLLQISMTNGSSTKLMTLTVDGGVVPWFGAGVTTDSPTKP
jgi:hypothetical protein